MSLAQYIYENEQRDGIRFSFNIWPSSKVEAAKLVVPVAAIFTPLKSRPDLPLLSYEPLYCTRNSCRAVINPYCFVDYSTKTWTCNFCMQRNGFPASYSGMDEQHRPAELYPQYATIEYTLPNLPPATNVFLFVIDTCISEEELNGLKLTIDLVLSKLPKNCLVGLITFGRIVQIHELVTENLTVSYVFKGTKEMNATQLQELIGISTHARGANPSLGQTSYSKFIMPLSQCESSLSELLNFIQCDPWPITQGKRPIRSTGAALNIAVNLLEVLYPNTGARILLFIGGPCTQGPGIVVDDELKHPIRSHHDIQKDNVKFLRKATKFYESIANRAASSGYVIDIFSCCLDQTGLYEMKYCANYTGGVMVMGDSFMTVLFKESCLKLFEKDDAGKYNMGLNGVIEVKTSRELKISGCIGLCVSLNQKGQNVSDQEIGIGNTNSWRMGFLNDASSYVFFFDIATQIHQHGVTADSGQGYVQFLTRYQRASGVHKLRVTTVNRSWVEGSLGAHQISASFDQDAAAVITARIAVYRCEVEETSPPDILRWLDKLLIRLCQRFGQYEKDNPSTFQLPENFVMFPQYMFHLRRSQFLQIFNNSPDETSYYRHCLLFENVQQCIIMILPILYSYSLNGAEPVMLDSTSILPDRILLMDDFFHIVIYHGETIDGWRKAGYQNDPQYKVFADLLQAPINDASELLRRRFPMPRYVVTEANGSQARFLFCKVNPSQTHNTMWGQEGGAPVLTDDVNLQVFFDHLKKLAVSSNT